MLINSLGLWGGSEVTRVKCERAGLCRCLSSFRVKWCTLHTHGRIKLSSSVSTISLTPCGSCGPLGNQKHWLLWPWFLVESHLFLECPVWLLDISLVNVWVSLSFEFQYIPPGVVLCIRWPAALGLLGLAHRPRPKNTGKPNVWNMACGTWGTLIYLVLMGVHITKSLGSDNSCNLQCLCYNLPAHVKWCP